jgi:hypothetical protein
MDEAIVDFLRQKEERERGTGQHCGNSVLHATVYTRVVAKSRPIQDKSDQRGLSDEFPPPSQLIQASLSQIMDG